MWLQITEKSTQVYLVKDEQFIQSEEKPEYQVYLADLNDTGNLLIHVTEKLEARYDLSME